MSCAWCQMCAEQFEGVPMGASILCGPHQELRRELVAFACLPSTTPDDVSAKRKEIIAKAVETWKRSFVGKPCPVCRKGWETEIVRDKSNKPRRLLFGRCSVCEGSGKISAEMVGLRAAVEA